MNFPDYPEMPAALRIPQDERNAAWKGRKLMRQGSAFREPPSREEEAATKQLRKELEKAEDAKREARFDRLRELKAERKISRSK